MEEKNRSHSNGECCNCKQRGNWLKRRNGLAKRISDVISITCGSSRRMRRKAKEMCDDKPKERKTHQLAFNNKSPPPPLMKFQQAKKKKKQQYRKDAKRGLTVVSSSSRLSGILRNSAAGINLKKWKTIKTRFANAKNCNATKTTNGSIIGSKPISIHHWTAKIARKRGAKKKKKKTQQQQHYGDGNKELELCKKRILMGGKCRPLNLSGALHYDQHGILLPEDIITS